MVIRQGDVVWANFGKPVGSAPGYRRPAIVIQSDHFNESALATLVVVSLTTNVRRQFVPGNVLLRKGEANLREVSVVNMSQISTIDRSQVTQKIGALSSARLVQVLDGVCFVLGLTR
ncbi:MAG: type II toxin-antitoxin system PemK/MazF family toxin [Tepidisphaeraceae bacterium]